MCSTSNLKNLKINTKKVTVLTVLQLIVLHKVTATLTQFVQICMHIYPESYATQ